METNQPLEILVLVDGECALCHWFVRWYLKNEKKESSVVYFGSLQDAGFGGNSLQSVVLIKGNVLYYKTDALKCLMPYLKRRSRWWIKMLVWLPAFVRNFVYDCIASYRYRCFGKIPRSCMEQDFQIRKRWISAKDYKDLLQNFP